MERLTTNALIRLARPNMKQGMTAVLLLQKFEEICAQLLEKNVALHVKGSYIKAKVLYVKCAHPSVGMEFTFQIPTILKKMQEKGMPIKQIKLV